MQDLIAASSKPQFQDYTLERVQDDEEAYRAAGYSVAEAKTIPSGQLNDSTLPGSRRESLKARN